MRKSVLLQFPHKKVKDSSLFQVQRVFHLRAMSALLLLHYWRRHRNSLTIPFLPNTVSGGMISGPVLLCILPVMMVSLSSCRVFATFIFIIWRAARGVFCRPSGMLLYLLSMATNAIGDPSSGSGRPRFHTLLCTLQMPATLLIRGFVCTSNNSPMRKKPACRGLIPKGRIYLRQYLSTVR